MNERKNLSMLLDALATLPPPLRLVVAGPPGPTTEAFVAKADRLGLAERVSILGFVPDADLTAVLRGAMALVHPSLDEGFGFTPLEAMAAGVPSIVAASGSLPEVVGDAAVVVGAGDAASWAGAIAALADDDDRRAVLVARGIERAARFDWSATGAATAAVHRRVAGV
jgi:glycosyltransferase involved in cell wall biosynthesis